MTRRMLLASACAATVLLGCLGGRATAQSTWHTFPQESTASITLPPVPDDATQPSPLDAPSQPADADQTNPPSTPTVPSPGATEDVKTPAPQTNPSSPPAAPSPPAGAGQTNPPSATTDPRPGATEDVKTPAPKADSSSSSTSGKDSTPAIKYSWGGQYRIVPNASNFPFQPVAITNEQPDQWFVNQRMRVWATVNPNDHVEGYIQFQVGGFNWGDNTEFPKTFVGPFAAPGDTIGIELRRGWVAYKDDECGKVRVGILDWHDSFGDTLASSDYDFDVAGVDWTVTLKDCNNLKLIVGAFQLSDLPLITSETSPLGAHTSDLFTVDADQPIGEKSSVGGSAYFLVDHGDYSYPTFAPYGSSYDIWLGLRGKTVLKGALPVNGFVLLNTGERTDVTGATVLQHTGWAGKAEAGPLWVGCGKFSAQVLASTGSSNPGVGDTSEFRTVAQTFRDNFGSQGYWSYLYLTSPNGPSDVQDLGVSLQNRGLGLITAQAKYDVPLSCKLTSTSAAGWLESACPNPTSGSSNMGTELAQQFTYDFGGGLKLDTGFAYLFTGDFYKASRTDPTPHNLYEIFARLQLEF